MLKKNISVLLVLMVLIVLYSYVKKSNPQKNNSLIKPTVEIKKIVKKLEKISLSVSEPKDNITVNNPTLNIKGKTLTNAYVFINEQELRADKNGQFISMITLEEGENYVLIVVSDDAGNSLEKDIIVNLESTN